MTTTNLAERERGSVESSMKTTISPFASSARACALAAVLLAGCGYKFDNPLEYCAGGGNPSCPPPSGTGGDATAPPAPVMITPASATVSLRRRLQLTADQPVTWSVVEGPAGGSVNASGLYQAPATVGTTHVVATSARGATATATLTIVPLTLDVIAGRLQGPGNLDEIGTSARFNAPFSIGQTVGTDHFGMLISEVASPTTLRRLKVVSPAAVDTLPSGLHAAGVIASELNVFADGFSVQMFEDGAYHNVSGDPGTPGYIDGPDTTARFRGIACIAADPAFPANPFLYIADPTSQTIRFIDGDVEQVTTIAGREAEPGHRDGPASDALFNGPMGLVVFEDVLYISDRGNGIRTLDLTTNQVGTLMDTGHDYDVLVSDRAGHLFAVQDASIVKIDLAARTVTTFAGQAYGPDDPTFDGSTGRDGAPDVARFAAGAPMGMALDIADRLLVADSGNNAIRAVDPDTGEVSTVAGALGCGRAECTADAETAGDGWRYPIAIAMTSPSNVLVTDFRYPASHDAGAGVVGARAIDLTTRQVADRGLLGALSAQNLDTQGSPAAALATTLVPVTVEPDASAGVLVGSLSGRSSPSAAQLYDPATGALVPVLDPSGQKLTAVPIAPASGGALVVDTVTNAKNTHVVSNVSTLALKRSVGPDGKPAVTGVLTPLISIPTDDYIVGAASGSSGALYFTVAGSHAVFQVAPGVASPASATFLAGLAGTPGYLDSTGTSARFNSPTGLVADGAGGLLVVDQGNGVIRRIDLGTGAVTTEVGIAGVRGVQPGLLPTSLNSPRSIALAPNGDLLIVDESAVLRVR
jgi:hypothetical protein